MEKATFGAGCFWHVEEAFRHVPGVVETAVGFMGGHTKDPTYKEVCSHTTGHAEVVQLAYDPERVTYEKLLEVFFDLHNPTTLNRQGPDVGDQYRSVVFYHTEGQRSAALSVMDKLEKSGRFRRPLVTKVQPADEFYRAEEYHQRYLEKRGLSACAV